MNSALVPANPVILVDDEAESLDSLELTFKSNGLSHLRRCQDSRLLLPLLQQHSAEVIILDLAMPHLGGEALQAMLSRDYPELPVIVVTGLAELDKAVSCMRAGAFDYMVKPVEPGRLVNGLKRAMEVRSLARENSLLRDRLLTPDTGLASAFSAVITANPRMFAIFRYIEAVAGTSQCVTIMGETGVGKELMVRAIHELSGRAGERVTVNVSGLDEHLFADALFGHEQGAFTGADRARAGLIEKAAGGTLFLDEIGDLSMAAQVKLLRVLQENEYYRLGSDEPRVCTAKVVVATQSNLKTLQEQGKCRKDLFYRLMTHHVVVPPLRERLDTDLALLVDHFLSLAARELHKPRPTVPPEILSLLRVYHFPGNVRELKGMIFDAVSRHTSKVLSLDSLRAHLATTRGTSPYPLAAAATDMDATAVAHLKPGLPLPTIRDATNRLIDLALSKAGGNRTVAAQILGITPQALGQRLKRAGAQAGWPASWG